jgi:hypothetical protein
MSPKDQKQLQILSRLHYVGAALACIIPLLGLLYAAFGIAILLGRFPGQAPIPGEAFGWLPIAAGMVALLFGITAVSLNLLTARALRERKKYLLCVIASAMNCVHFPLGVLLGTFTLIVLCRPAVSAAFEAGRGAPPASPSDVQASPSDVQDRQRGGVTSGFSDPPTPPTQQTAPGGAADAPRA